MSDGRRLFPLPAPHPLLHAAEGGDGARVAALLAEGADPEERSADGWSALILASKEGHVALVSSLLGAGASANPPDSGSHSALRGAAIFGHAVVCEALLDAGARPNLTSAGGRTPLMGAAMHGHAAVVELLCRRGADPALRNDFGETAGELAAARGHTACVAALGEAVRRPTPVASEGAVGGASDEAVGTSKDAVGGASDDEDTAVLSADSLDLVLSFLTPSDLWSCAGVSRAWRAAASAPHRWGAAASGRFGAWADAGPLADWLRQHRHSPRAVLLASLRAVSVGSNAGPQSWGVPTPPPEPSFGQLGQGIADGECCWPDDRIPRPVAGPACALSSVSCGGHHVWALTPAGEAWAWGANAFGMLGLGDRRSRTVPERVALPAPAAAAECGYAFTLVRLVGGSVLSCGFNRNGRCGVPAGDERATRSEDGDSLLLRPTPCAAAAEACAAGARRLVGMACGSGHAGFVMDDGCVRLFGRNDRGQCGPAGGAGGWGGGGSEEFEVRVGEEEGAWRPKPVPGVPPCAVRLACGPYHTLALLSAGKGGGRVWQWGDVSDTPQAPPHPVQGLERIVQARLRPRHGSDLASCSRPRLLLPPSRSPPSPLARTPRLSRSPALALPGTRPLHLTTAPRRPRAGGRDKRRKRGHRRRRVRAPLGRIARQPAARGAAACPWGRAARPGASAAAEREGGALDLARRLHRDRRHGRRRGVALDAVFSGVGGRHCAAPFH